MVSFPPWRGLLPAVVLSVLPRALDDTFLPLLSALGVPRIPIEDAVRQAVTAIATGAAAGQSGVWLVLTGGLQLFENTGFESCRGLLKLL